MRDYKVTYSRNGKEETVTLLADSKREIVQLFSSLFPDAILISLEAL